MRGPRMSDSALGRSGRARCVLGGLVALVVASPALAHDPPAPTTPAAAAGTAVSDDVAPIPLAQIASESEALQPWLRQAAARVAPEPEVASLQERLAPARDRLATEVNESRVRLTEHPSIDALDDMLREWTGRNERVNRARATLTLRATSLGALLEDTTRRQRVWSATLEAARAEHAPANVIETIDTNRAALAALAAQATARRGQILSLVDQVSRAGTSVEALIEDILQASNLARREILERDAPPLSSAAEIFSGWRDVPDGIAAEVTSDGAGLVDYFAEDPRSLWLAALVFLGTLPLAFGLQTHVERRLAAGQKLEGTAEVFGRPIAIALLIGLLAGRVGLGNAPSLALYLSALVTLAPIVRLLLPILPKPVRPALLAVGGFFVLDRLRMLVDRVTIVERGLLLLEAGVAVALAVVLLRSRRWRDMLASVRLGTLARRAIQLALALLVVAVVAELAGYVMLARLLVGGILDTLVAGIVVYALDRIATTALLIAVSTPSAQRSRIVHVGAPQIVRYGERVIRAALAVYAALTVLHAFLMDRTVLGWLSSLFFTPLEVGALSIALSDLAAFGITLLAAFWLSRFVRFALEEEVFPRIRLQRGVPTAISATAGYLMLLGGFLLAVSASGIEMSRFTVLAGAFGVGVGFGLQNVVNNFVSGLILLYERPVQIGDVIQIGESVGTITRIGIRSSTMRTFKGAEVIVPNGNLISEEVTNWTLSDRERRIEIPVGVAYGSDHLRVLEVLRAALADAPDVLAFPSPDVLFAGLGDSSLDFEVRIWTINPSYGLVRSDVLGRIYAALAEAGIEIPFPQRDLNVRSLDPRVARTLFGSASAEAATARPPRAPAPTPASAPASGSVGEPVDADD